MGIIELVILGVSLAMDAFAVTISNSFAYPTMRKRDGIWMPIAFGFFQGLMPVIGYFVGSLVSGLISQVAGIVTFVILGFIGGKMIWDAFHEEDDENHTITKLTPLELLLQSIATSIDALAVGVSFAALSVDIMQAASIIAITTFACCVVALIIGRAFGKKLGRNATILGGLVLIAIGIKALF